MWQIEFYETERGECPLDSFIDGSNAKVRSKFVRALDLLEEYGPGLKRPFADILRDGIRELRIRFGTDRIRALYFFFEGSRIIVTHGFVKKTDEVPVSEIERAIRCRNNFLSRHASRRRKS